LKFKADCHIHLDKIGGPHKTPPPTVEVFVEYACRAEVSLFFAIYELEETLASFRATEIDIVPIYWERKPLAPSVPASARGIKLHPYIEEYVLIKENVEPALEVARERGLFVFIHTEDRKPELSRGSLVASLAQDYPDLIFVMAHSGSYAPPKADECGASWVNPNLVRELVSEAVEVARNFDNVYLESSILASDIKAEILARAPISKMLIGSDFAILADTIWSSLRFQEEQLKRFGLVESEIEQIHQNAKQFGLQ
jgi:predicted TIM-barrel fold metal-dependent hydrolase